MGILSGVPSICQRCKRPVPRRAQFCPHCTASLERIDPARLTLQAFVAVVLFAVALVIAYAIYQVLG